MNKNLNQSLDMEEKLTHHYLKQRGYYSNCLLCVCVRVCVCAIPRLTNSHITDNINIIHIETVMFRFMYHRISWYCTRQVYWFWPWHRGLSKFLFSNSCKFWFWFHSNNEMCNETQIDFTYCFSIAPAPSPTLMKTSSIVVTETPNPDMPYSALWARKYNFL